MEHNILITGAAQRIGRAIALDLGRHGWRVAVHHRRSTVEAAAVVTEIAQSGGFAVALGADLNDEAETEALVGRAQAALGGRLDALVNNASVFEPDEWHSADAQSWHHHMQVNLRAPFLLSQAFARAAAGQSGAIVNLVDQRVWKPTPAFLSYGVSKAGLWALTRMLAQALAPSIRVNAVGPGPVMASVHQSADQFARQQQALPLGHGATPEEIAAAVRFLLEAGAVTGQMIAVDGGQHIAWHTPDVIGTE